MNQSKPDKTKTAIIMMNMGGPGSLEEVEPFLYNLFMDPDIIDIPFGKIFRPFIARRISKSRAAKVKEYYKKIGGKSPLLDLTMKQAELLETSLKNDGHYKTYVAMRYTQPFTAKTIERVIKDRVSRIILLPLYPQYSKTTTGSSLNEFTGIFKKYGKIDVEFIEIRDWQRK